MAVIGGGYTGLATAWHLRQLDPSVSVALIEAEEIAFGASGRNSGWVMPHLGIGGDMLRQIYGEQRAREAHEYATRACAYVEEIVSAHRLDSDFRRHGAIRVAIGPQWVGALEAEMESLRRTGFGDTHEWLDRDEVRREVNGPWFEAGIAERTTAFLQPVKHARELKRLAIASGVAVYERTPVIDGQLTAHGVQLITPSRKGHRQQGRAGHQRIHSPAAGTSGGKAASPSIPRVRVRNHDRAPVRQTVGRTGMEPPVRTANNDQRVSHDSPHARRSTSPGP